MRQQLATCSSHSGRLGTIGHPHVPRHTLTLVHILAWLQEQASVSGRGRVGPGFIARPDPWTPGSLPVERLISIEQEYGTSAL